MKNISTGTRPHYEILDGLRGVAALVVLLFHIFEAFATSHLDQRVNHGYLAVDFFFILSGFVVGYAYDSRWGAGMRPWAFFKRRIARLHPMVVMGTAIGVAMFYMQDSSAWNTAAVGLGALSVVALLGALLIPATPGAEVRGIGEMFPLNGPAWSLFFEYLGNILYALVIRRLPTRWLAALTAAAGCGLAAAAILGPAGDVCAGWQFTPAELRGGGLRLLFSFSAGLLLRRLFGRSKGGRIKGAFWICSAVLVTLLAIPRVGGAERLWLNGVYDIACCAAAFPLIVALGAKGASSGFTARACRFLGELSYPLYMVHYPLIYLYYGWVKDNGLTFAQSLPGAAGVVAVSVALAWVCLKLYDAPVRRWLAARWLTNVKKM